MASKKRIRRPTKKSATGERKWVKSFSELGQIVGRHHHSFSRWARRHRDAPKPRQNGDHCVAAWREFFERHPEIKLEAPESSGARAILEMEKLRQQTRRIALANDVTEKKLIPLAHAQQ